MNKETWILGIQIPDRTENALEVQAILTKFGCSIKTRLGLHQVGEETGGYGMILLELAGIKEEFYKLENELLAIPDLKVRKMVF